MPKPVTIREEYMIQIMEYKRILFIAPSGTGLNVSPEIDTIERLGFSVRSVEGDVTSDRLFNIAVESGAQYDIIHFATHASEDGILLSHAEKLSKGGLLQIARKVNAKVIFLNACETSDFCHWLADNDVPVTIGVKAEISDTVARHTAQVFYAKLAETNDIRSAYKLSKPADIGIYVLVTDGNYTNAINQPILDRFDKFERFIVNSMEENNKTNSRIRWLQVGTGLLIISQIIMSAWMGVLH